MNRFSEFHPAVLLLFFSASIAFVMSMNHPVISALSLICALAYSAVTNGKKAWKTAAVSVLVIATVGIFNFLFAHYGEDILFTVKEMNFTLQTLFYGLNQGVVLAAAFLWFSALSECIDSEKVIYLFRFAPKTALIFAMVLGFIPRFTKKLGDIRDAHTALLGGERPKSLKEKMTTSLAHFSALISYALESSIVTADSMTARAYRPQAVRASRYHMKAADVTMIAVMLLLFLFVAFQKMIGNLSFVFEPKTYIERLSLPACAAFLIVEMIPAAVEVKEKIQWKLSSVKV